MVGHLSMIRSLSDLLAAGALKRKTITVQGQELCIRELSVEARRRFVESTNKDATSCGAVLVELCVVDPDTGAPIVPASEAAKLVELAPALVDGIAREVLALSGMGDDPGPKG